MGRLRIAIVSGS